MVDFLSSTNINKVVNDYSENLTNAIKIVKNQDFNPLKQIKDISEYRSEARIVQQWLDFDNSLG
jgi:hypothetical protein